MYNGSVYKGSFTWSWNDTNATSTASFGSSTLFRFNAVKVEAVSFIDITTGFPPNPLPGPLFVSCPELNPLSFEFIAGKPVSILGGAQWSGGAYLLINNALSPIKMTSRAPDFLRGSLTFTILGGDGLPITSAVPAYKAVTISFWEVCENKSSTS